jgi:hypothetical protein
VNVEMLQIIVTFQGLMMEVAHISAMNVFLEDVVAIIITLVMNLLMDMTKINK